MVYDEDSDDIKKTYNKMTGRMVENTDSGIEDDDFYKYFYNLLENGRNYCKFSFVRLVKSVDSEWVEAIEEAMPSIHNVVLNPRKYIEEEREVVNIAMARNISTESLRHLLSHSNYIDEYREDGTVIPNRILNIYKEESLNTYENRFIYTLIMELQMFINKRFDAIFEASKDELGAYFEMNSLVDNYTETVDYKLKIKIRDKQTDVSNETNEESIFNRISKIHKQINMLAASEFAVTMRRFPIVRHPIVKTNAIGKNLDYKKCHKLWNFIYSYNQIGYQVNLMKQDPTISRSFEKDIYDSFIWNYAMLHNHMENVDALNIRRNKKDNNMEIADIRQMLEEIVRGFDMPEANLRKLINNELAAVQRKVKQEKLAAERVVRITKQNEREEKAQKEAAERQNKKKVYKKKKR